MTNFSEQQAWIQDSRCARHLLQELIVELKHGNLQRDEARAKLLATTSLVRQLLEGGDDRW